jgi:hypothetical protein
LFAGVAETVEAKLRQPLVAVVLVGPTVVITLAVTLRLTLAVAAVAAGVNPLVTLLAVMVARELLL